MLRYKIIEIFTSEEAQWRSTRLAEAIIEAIQELKIPARVLVSRGVAGLFENGEIASGQFEILSLNMPLRITIVAPSSDCERILARLEELVSDGLVAVQDLSVVSHKTRGRLLARQLRVREIMTPNPKKVRQTTPLNEVAQLLLSSEFTGVPVIDEQERPVGVIAQGDLIYKANMPMRLGILAQTDRQQREAVLAALATKSAEEVMTRPVISVAQECLVTEAVQLMLDALVKRLPVVDTRGKLVGILSRVDVFRAITHGSPDWQAFQRQNIQVDNLRFVADIMRRDTSTVLPETPVEEVLRIIDRNDMQRVCVVDREGKFLGLIADRDLLSAFTEHHPSIWEYFTRTLSGSDHADRELSEQLRAKTAAEVMNTEIVTVREDAPLEEAIALMLARAIKRLPVVDDHGRFKGMINRDSLLRTGFGVA